VLGVLNDMYIVPDYAFALYGAIKLRWVSTSCIIVRYPAPLIVL
jgi:hypothetical protein